MRARTVFLGDSLTSGFQQGPGYLPPRYYPITNLVESSLRGRLRELGSDKDLVIVNQGMDGDSTRGMLERFDRSVATEEPSLVLLWGGINDLSTRKTPEEVYGNIVELIRRTEAIDATPIVLNVAPVAGLHFNDTIRELNKLTGVYCEENGVLLIDVFGVLVDDEGKLPDEYTCDGIHLSDKGYQKIMPLIHQSILKIVRDQV